MKIGIFTNNYLPNPYGVTRSIETFRLEFEKRGHSVFIFAPYWKGYEDNNPRVFRYPSIDIKIKFRFPLAIPYSRKMDKIIKSLDLDVIHAHHPNLLGNVAMKWAKKKKIPLIFTWHTLYDQYTNFVPFIPSKISAYYMIRKAVKFAKKSNAVIVPTDSIIPILRNWGLKNKNIIPIATGVSEEEFKNADRKKIRNKYKIGEDEIVMLIVSRLTSEKNVEFVFRSVSAILKNINPSLLVGEEVLYSRQERVLNETEKNENKSEFKDLYNVSPSPELDYQLDLSQGERWGNIRFLVVGDGYLKAKLQEFCQKENILEKVIFCGEVEREEMKNYYACSDIFVYGSKSETQGMIITEAMYMGLPIVALSATGINSLVLNRGNGFLVSENSPYGIPLCGSDKVAIPQGEKEFQKAILKLIQDKDLRKKFSETSSKIAKMKFTASICAEKTLEVYDDAIKNKNCHSERA